MSTKFLALFNFKKWHPYLYFLLPQLLRDHADLQRKVVTVGQGNKIEVWSADVWNKGKSEWLSPAGRQRLQDSDEFGSLQI